MFHNVKIGLGIAFAALFSVTSQVQATPAFTFTGADSGFTNGSWVMSELFSVGASNISVDELGFYDNGSDGFSGGHEVGIFDSAGTLLVSTVVTNASVLIDKFRWNAVSAITLLANQAYRVTGVTHSDLYNTNTNISVDSRITRTGDAWCSGSSLVFCNAGSSGLYWVANFGIQDVPEPATLALLGLGLAGFGFAARKKLN